MIIAVDFDGTIVEHKYPKIGRPVPYAIDILLKLQKDGHTLLLWSVRDGKLLDEAVRYCEQNGLIFYAANKNYPEEDRLNPASRKLNADLYIDECALGGLFDWKTTYRIIQAMKDGEVSFEKRMAFRREGRKTKYKRNFLIRLGEMLEGKSRY